MSLVIIMLLAAASASSAYARSGPFGILKGRVLDVDTGRPVEGATLTFKAEGVSLEIRDEVVSSGADGRFVVAPIYVGPSGLIVEAQGYHTLRTVVIVRNRGTVASFETRKWAPRRHPFAAVSGGSGGASAPGGPGFNWEKLQTDAARSGRLNPPGTRSQEGDADKPARDIAAPKKNIMRTDEDLVILISKLERDRKAGRIIERKPQPNCTTEHCYETVLPFEMGSDGEPVKSSRQPEEPVPSRFLFLPEGDGGEAGATYVLVEPEADSSMRETVREPDYAWLDFTAAQSGETVRPSVPPREAPAAARAPAVSQPAPQEAVSHKSALQESALQESALKESALQESALQESALKESAREEAGGDADTYSGYHGESDIDAPSVSGEERLVRSGGWEEAGAGGAAAGNDKGLSVVSLIDELTSKPVKGAVIKLDGAEAESIGGGHYRLPAVEPGPHLFSVEMPGYETIADELRIGGEPEHFTMYMKSTRR